jgi:hypothetical protein
VLPARIAVTFRRRGLAAARVLRLAEKQGAGSAHAKVGGYRVLLRWLNPLVATVSTRTRRGDRRDPTAGRQRRVGAGGVAVDEAIVTARRSPPPAWAARTAGSSCGRLGVSAK